MNRVLVVFLLLFITGCIPSVPDNLPENCDTVIHGVHIRKSGHIPTHEELKKGMKIMKDLKDSLSNMSDADKDSLKTAYRRFFHL